MSDPARRAVRSAAVVATSDNNEHNDSTASRAAHAFAPAARVPSTTGVRAGLGIRLDSDTENAAHSLVGTAAPEGRSTRSGRTIQFRRAACRVRRKARPDTAARSSGRGIRLDSDQRTSGRSLLPPPTRKRPRLGGSAARAIRERGRPAAGCELATAWRRRRWTACRCAARRRESACRRAQRRLRPQWCTAAGRACWRWSTIKGPVSRSSARTSSSSGHRNPTVSPSPPRSHAADSDVRAPTIVSAPGQCDVRSSAKVT